jgi:branched-chain amino acid transport system permease protein
VGLVAMTFWVVQTLNGLSFGMLLFLLAAGLSLIYGLMKILNLTHGSFYLLGGYIGLVVVHRTGSFVLAALAGSLAIALVGIVMERFFLRRFHLQELPQALLTFGFLFIFSDLATVIWGGNPQTMPKPAMFGSSIQLGPFFYPTYRLFIIGFGLAVAALLWWLQEGTRIGAMVRASVDDEEVARSLGINVSLLFTLVFALGAFLAALGGVMGGPIVGVYPGADFEVLLLGFVVVIIGGLGSLKGALVGGLVVGLLDNFGKVLFPELALFTIFAPMAVILALRPAGLFGRE